MLVTLRLGYNSHISLFSRIDLEVLVLLFLPYLYQ